MAEHVSEAHSSNQTAEAEKIDENPRKRRRTAHAVSNSLPHLDRTLIFDASATPAGHAKHGKIFQPHQLDISPIDADEIAAMDAHLAPLVKHPIWNAHPSWRRYPKERVILSSPLC